MLLWATRYHPNARRSAPTAARGTWMPVASQGCRARVTLHKRASTVPQRISDNRKTTLVFHDTVHDYIYICILYIYLWFPRACIGVHALHRPALGASARLPYLKPNETVTYGIIVNFMLLTDMKWLVRSLAAHHLSSCLPSRHARSPGPARSFTHPSEPLCRTQAEAWQLLCFLFGACHLESVFEKQSAITTWMHRALGVAHAMYCKLNRVICVKKYISLH